jgi:hypothetical protein
MSIVPASAPVQPTFQVDSIEKVASPDGSRNDCFRYVISQGPGAANPIIGMRWGSLEQVRAEVTALVTQMNDRLFGGNKKRG